MIFIWAANVNRQDKLAKAGERAKTTGGYVLNDVGRTAGLQMRAVRN